MDDHDAFIGTDNGLYTYNDKGKAERIVHDSCYPQTLVNNIVWSIFKDRWNNIWLGTDNGISCFLKTSIIIGCLDDITGNGDVLPACVLSGPVRHELDWRDKWADPFPDVIRRLF